MPLEKFNVKICMSIDQLKNKGIYMLNQESGQAGSRQIIVLGSARGGTSIISGALHHLGVFTGKQSCAPVYEDVYLSNALEGNRVMMLGKSSRSIQPNIPYGLGRVRPLLTTLIKLNGCSTTLFISLFSKIFFRLPTVTIYR